MKWRRRRPVDTSITVDGSLRIVGWIPRDLVPHGGIRIVVPYLDITADGTALSNLRLNDIYVGDLLRGRSRRVTVDLEIRTTEI